MYERLVFLEQHLMAEWFIATVGVAGRSAAESQLTKAGGQWWPV